MSSLVPEKGFIFRIVHADCVAWILKHGLHCKSSTQQDPHYVNIGSKDLIDRRAAKSVPIAPGGTLSDYVPFYFTPYSIMMYNIHTGYGGITLRENKDIAIFVSSVHRLRELKVPFVFTNQHAYAAGTEFFDDLKDLKRIDWPLLQSRNFKTDDADPGKQLRYQAEVLVHQHVPLGALLGIGCYNEGIRGQINSMVAAKGLNLNVKTVPDWYFR